MSSRKPPELLCSARAADRIGAAREFLALTAAGDEALIVAASPEAADDLVRAVGVQRGALFGAHRLTFNRLIGLLAAEKLADDGLVPAAPLAAEAVAARAVFRLRGSQQLAYFGPVIERPGFPGALARTLSELRLNGIRPADLERLDPVGPALAALLHQFDIELRAAGLADRASMIEAAVAAVTANAARRFSGIATLLLDVRIDNAGERDLVAAIAARAPRVLATAAAGDDRTIRNLVDALGIDVTVREPEAVQAPGSGALAHLAANLFGQSTPPEGALDESVALFSAAGEMQECVEIARRIQSEARRGVTFDRIAVVLHAPSRYAPYLEEALERASIPAYFARGASRPEPGGRAMLALLACAAENLSARRFAEYLSLSQVRNLIPEGEDGEFVAAENDYGAGSLRDDLEPVAAAKSTEDDPSPVVEPAARAPWRWERLLIDAAVIGSRDRWERRLAGLEAQLRLQRGEVEAENGARAAAIDRHLTDLGHLRSVAMPLIDRLAMLPRAATWSEWLAHLRAIAENAIRDRDAVLAALSELEPMGPVGPITLDEVRLVLAERLGHLERPPARRRYGAVFVAPPEMLRGMEFDVTLVPGLVERVFPRKLVEDPILPDAARRQLSPTLATQVERAAAERLALRLAIGAACKRTMVSYPRVDLDQGRPRVPSFYALEIMRAAEGRLPGFDELARRAAGEHPTRLGWPAPMRPGDAIDEAEFDLAVLDKLIGGDAEKAIGAAHYLLDANPHLGRALRARARRWLRRWTPNDGLVDAGPSELAALARHQLSQRSYSPTALQNFAACPYRFFLQAIQRLQPREEIEAIEVIDPLTRGALVHEVQFEFLSAMREAARLPVTSETLASGYAMLEAKLVEVALRYHDELAPAIERVWLDGIDSIRADLREWLRRSAMDAANWRPERFELAFGLADRAQADPASVAEPVALEIGLRLRGSIDLIERSGGGSLRVTDHKTGRVRAAKNLVIGGGKIMQPVLYALAAERVLDRPVGTGRLYYCTAAGGYEERIVVIDDESRKAAADFVAIIGSALSEGFLPAAPDARECDYCDYRRVCGPYENLRVEYKTAAARAAERLANLRRLRGMR